MSETRLPYLQGYPETLRREAQALLITGELERRLAQSYPQPSTIRTDGQLRAYVLELKNRFIRRGPPLSKICFDETIGVSHGALGLHTYAKRQQGAKTKAKNELRVASLFKELPEPFLRMVVVHELAHLKEKEHNKAFYQLCGHMEPDYARFELDLRLFLTAREYAEKPERFL